MLARGTYTYTYVYAIGKHALPNTIMLWCALSSQLQAIHSLIQAFSTSKGFYLERLAVHSHRESEPYIKSLIYGIFARWNRKRGRHRWAQCAAWLDRSIRLLWIERKLEVLMLIYCLTSLPCEAHTFPPAHSSFIPITSSSPQESTQLEGMNHSRPGLLSLGVHVCICAEMCKRVNNHACAEMRSHKAHTHIHTHTLSLSRRVIVCVSFSSDTPRIWRERERDTKAYNDEVHHPIRFSKRVDRTECSSIHPILLSMTWLVFYFVTIRPNRNAKNEAFVDFAGASAALIGRPIYLSIDCRGKHDVQVCSITGVDDISGNRGSQSIIYLFSCLLYH